MHNRKGGAAVIVVSIVAVAVVGFGIWYFVSDPFRSKVDRAIEGSTTWTPEQIQADPIGYLGYAIDRTDNTKAALEASQIGLGTKLNGMKRRIEQKETEVTNYTALMEEARAVFAEVQAGNQTWPVTLRGATFDERTFKREMVDANNKLQGIQTLLANFRNAETLMENKMDEIATQLAEVERLRSDLDIKLEMAKVNQTIDGIEGLGTTLDTVIATADTLAISSSQMSFDDIAAPSASTSLDSDFEALMGGN